MSLKELPKKIQYLNIDSNFAEGNSKGLIVNFGLTSNTFIEEMKDVIGFKLIDFYITQVGLDGDGTGTGAKYVDIICDDIPNPAQLLDERNGRILARVPLERVTSNVIIHDKQWRSWERNTNYFNPISIKKLKFKLFEYRGDGSYVNVPNVSHFYMTFEVSTIDREAKTPDRNFELLKSIDNLCEKIGNFSQKVEEKTKKVEEKETKKLPFSYLVLLIGTLIGIYMYINSHKPGTVAPNPIPQF